MFRTDPQHLAWTLDNLVSGQVVNQIRVPEAIAAPARKALDLMLEVVD
jgi:quinolinate synthase